MKNTRNSNKLLKLTAMFAFPCALFGGVLMGSAQTASAEETKTYHYDEKHVTNHNFSDISSVYLDGNSLSGWNVTDDTANLPGKGMIIDVGTKVETGDGEAESENFAKYKDTFILNTNPEAKDRDTKILMINSKSSKQDSNREARKGYSSSSIELNANSYHIIKISAKAMKNGDTSVEGSIYLTGLKDKNGKPLKLAFEKISPEAWTDYYFLVATGNTAQTVKLECYLGSKSTDSSGVMFFDSSSVIRYSQNQFFDYAFRNYGYKGSDVLSTEGTKLFAIDVFANEKSTLEQISGYNFDFEDTSKGIADNWEVLGQTNATAKIAYYADFGDDSTLAGLGDSFEYNNSRALVMQASSQAYDSSTQYVALKSKNITIEPHACYKVSLDVKLSTMQRGSFYLKVSENGTIYETYKGIITESDVPLSSGKTNGIKDNSANEWTNNYQTITYYIKGHSLYYSDVNLELWLGDATAPATGSVVIDNISVEKVNESEVSSSDLLTLKSNTQTLNITNGAFDTALASTDKKAYPLSVNNWSVSSESDKNCDAGVVYLPDNETYDAMYEGYDWAGININNNTNKQPNNVFMMFNRDNSYQTLTSPSISLSGSEYHTISFDFYNQDFRDLNAPAMKVEVVDSNGILLFSQDNISSLNSWKTMSIFFKTTSAKSHSVTLKIYFGQADAKVGGMCYLDNFSTTVSDATAYEKASYKTDITGFLTHLDFASGTDANRITSTSAYIFTANSLDSDYSNAQSAVGGIVNGTNNEFDIINENDNFLAITNICAAKSSLKTNFNLDDFAANSYYKLSFSLATIFNESAKDASTEEHECGYGVSILIDGFEEVAHIVNNGTLQDYEIYFKTGDSSSTPTLEFILNSDCAETVGTALLTNLAISASDVDKYTAVKGYSSYGESVFTSDFVVVEEEGEEDSTPEETPDTETDTEQESGTNWGIIASSLITSVAVIIGVAALAFRSVKLKKIEKVKAESYDKRVTENHEIILAKAQKLRDQELETLNIAKATIEKEKAELEELHKEFVKEQRIKDNEKISREMEKAFKSHAVKQSNLNEKLRILAEKIEFTKSADHLIELERRILSEQEEQKLKLKKKK